MNRETTKISWLLLGATSICLSGCTTALKVNNAGPTAESRVGIAYALPYTQFNIKTTWSVASCDSAGAEIAIKTEQTATGAPDNDHVYVIDYRSLDSAMKISSLKADFYENGALKSLNAAAEDRTAEVLIKTVSAIGKIASFAAGTGSNVAPDEAKAIIICNKFSEDTLADVKKLRGDVSTKNLELEKQTVALEALTARIMRGGDATPDTVLTLHQTAINELSAKQIELESLKRQLETKLKSISYSDETKWPSTSTEFDSKTRREIPSAILMKWFSQKKGDEVKPLNAIKSSDLAREKSIHFSLRASGNYGSVKDSGDAVGAEYGVRYRFPAQGELLVCVKAACGTDPVGVDVLARLAVPILQKGQIFYLPFKSEAFANASLTAQFAQNGTISSAGYERKNAAAETAAGAADTTVDTAVSVDTAFRDAKQSKLDKIKAATDIAKAEKDLADAQKALLDSPNSATQLDAESLKADTALKEAELGNVRAELALIQARQELEKAQSDGN